MTNQSLLSVTQADIDAVNQHARNKINFGESLAEAFARHRLDHTAPADVVLRWEGDKLWLGEHYAGQVEKVSDWGKWSAEVRLGWEVTFHDTREEATAWVEQAVRDWLARAGLGRQGGEPVAYAGEMPGSNGGFSMAVFKAADVPIGSPLYAHPPASPTAEVVEALTAGISEYDAVVKACPDNKTFLGDKPCPKCKAERNEGCREEIRACFSFLSNARAALAKVRP